MAAGTISPPGTLWTMEYRQPKWDNDTIQFARLLVEIEAIGLNTVQRCLVAESMDISLSEIGELFDRAELVWKVTKKHVLDGAPSCRECGGYTEGVAACKACDKVVCTACYEVNHTYGPCNNTEEGGE